MKSTGGEGRPSGWRDKLRELWRDKRAWKRRAVPAVLASFAFAFTFTVFGPYELYITNMDYMNFPFSMLVMPMLAAGLAVFVFLCAVLLLLRGKVFNYAVSLLFAVTLAGYLQGNFLNVNHGTLDGATITWNTYKEAMLVSCAMWAAVIAAVLLVLYLSRRFWARMVQYVSALLVAVQVIAFVSLAATTDLHMDGAVYLSTEALFEVSGGQNVVFFLVDTFDKRYCDDLLALYPEWQDELQGFTWYRNFTGSYSRTVPSVTYLLTGVPHDYTIQPEEYFSKAWTESTFLRDIHDAGVTVHVYSDRPYSIGKGGEVQGAIDNLGTEEFFSINPVKVVRNMLVLSVYRYAPEMIKPFFYIYTGDLAGISDMQSGADNLFTTNDRQFWNCFQQDHLSVDTQSPGAFIFYHLQGAHSPFEKNENGEPDQYRRVVSDMEMIFQYIDELKALGLYDDTTIIISADHGETSTTLDAENRTTELEQARVLTLLVKPAGADANAPMQISDKQLCQDNLRASISGWFGQTDANGYRTIESISETEQMERYFWEQGFSEDGTVRDANLLTYRITGDANDFSNWELVSKEPIQVPFY